MVSIGGPLACVAASFLFSWWPLAAIGIIFAVIVGRWPLAIILGLMLDIIYGAPLGMMHILVFPFTIFAILGALVRTFLASYLRKGSPVTL